MSQNQPPQSPYPQQGFGQPQSPQWGQQAPPQWQPQWQQPSQYPPQQPMYPPQYPPHQQWQQPPPMQSRPPERNSSKCLWVIIGGVLLVLLLIGVVASQVGNSSQSGNTTTTQATQQAQQQSTQASQPTTQPTTAPKWTTTQTLTGNGVKKTALFTAPDDWKIAWSCDPNSFQGMEFNLVITVNNPDGTPIDVAVNTLCKPGNTSDSTEEHQGGTVYLDINSEGSWTVKVQELK